MTPEIKGFLLLTVIKLLAIFTITLVSVAYITLMERKLCAYMQFRYGPNRVGPRGWFQPLADGLKNILKEETFPAGANPVLFLLAPALALIPATMMSLVLPWAAPVPMNFDFTVPLLGRFVNTGLMPIAVADLPIGFLFVIAVSSMGVFGIALAGWSSNNKYSLLGGLRASAQMISYEVAMGLSLIPVLLLTGNVSFSQIITQQQASLWFVLPLFLSSFIFTVSSFAETNRVPFDLPESESELVAGYHTEYSAMKFSLFFIAEYANMITASAMISILFLGGYDIPFTHWDETPGLAQTIATGIMMFIKTTFWIFVFIWVRWTLPRFRYDQLMALGWKVLMPIGLAYVMYLGLGIYVAESVLGLTSVTAKMWLLFGMNLPVIYLVFLVLDRGHLISGSTDRARVRPPESSVRRKDHMAIGVKVMKRPEQDVSYVRATLKGMALTFRKMFQPKVTMQYPEQKSTEEYTISPRWRGTHRMLTDEPGRSKCVACGLCPQICPANCIKLVPGEDENGNRYPLIYEIDEFRCVFCGYCQEVCPEEAIHVGVHFENSEFSRDRFVYDLERLSSQTHPVSTLWDPTDPKGE